MFVFQSVGKDPDLTEGEDGQSRLHPVGDLRVIPHVYHQLHVRQPVDQLQDEMLHSAAPASRVQGASEIHAGS